MTLHKVITTAGYYRNYDGGLIDKLDAGTIVDKTDWVQGGMVFIKLGTLTDTVWTASGKTGWFDADYLAVYVPPVVDTNPTTDPSDFFVHYKVIDGVPVALERYEKVL